MLLGLASLSVWFAGGSAQLAWNAAAWTRQPWQLWSASLAHLSLAHVLVNLLALVLLALSGAWLRVGRSGTLALLLAWPLGTLALAWWPQVGLYSGMSGLLNGMLAVLCVHAILGAAPRTLSWFILGALALKLAREQAWSQPIAFDALWGFNVVYAAHLAGAVAGAVCGLAFEAVARLYRQRSQW